MKRYETLEIKNWMKQGEVYCYNYATSKEDIFIDTNTTEVIKWCNNNGYFISAVYKDYNSKTTYVMTKIIED